MNDLNEILNKIVDVCNSVDTNDEKHKLASELWTKYYELSDKIGIVSDNAYNMYLMLENESYIIDQKPIRKIIDNGDISKSIDRWHDVQNGNVSYLEDEDISNILDWTIENTRKNLELFSIDVDNNSLNGFCSMAQASMLIPLEKEGFNVTKNTATDSFNYPFNHYFGTVTFPTSDGEKTYLLDPTYRQFFSTVRCNFGRYFTTEENTGIKTAPDPGYFVKDTEFARELMGNGYIKLDERTSKLYGEGFTKAGLDYNHKNDEINLDYYNNILLTGIGSYSVFDDELEGFNLAIPNGGKNKRAT